MRTALREGVDVLEVEALRELLGESLGIAVSVAACDGTSCMLAVGSGVSVSDSERENVDIADGDKVIVDVCVGISVGVSCAVTDVMGDSDADGERDADGESDIVSKESTVVLGEAEADGEPEAEPVAEMDEVTEPVCVRVARVVNVNEPVLLELVVGDGCARMVRVGVSKPVCVAAPGVMVREPVARALGVSPKDAVPASTVADTDTDTVSEAYVIDGSAEADAERDEREEKEAEAEGVTDSDAIDLVGVAVDVVVCVWDVVAVTDAGGDSEDDARFDSEKNEVVVGDSVCTPVAVARIVRVTDDDETDDGDDTTERLPVSVIAVEGEDD